jgi:hypothetical protein
MNPKNSLYPNNLTWEELAKYIADMSPEDRKGNVSILLKDEIYPVPRIKITEDKDEDPAAGVLDEGHPYLVIGEPPMREVEVTISGRNIRGYPTETQNILFLDAQDLDTKIEKWATDTEWGKIDCEINDENSVLKKDEVKFLEGTGCSISQG